jgi:hypothetical protein
MARRRTSHGIRRLIVPTNRGPSPSQSLETAKASSDADPPSCASFYTARDWRNQFRFTLWVLAAGLAYIGATAALRWRAPGLLPWLLVGLAVLLAVQATRRYLVFLRAADELLRKIEMEALALGFAAGASFSLLYPLLEKLGAPELDEHATAVVMMLSWAAGSWLGTRRYNGRTAA